jgi:hypothetical protein
MYFSNFCNIWTLWYSFIIRITSSFYFSILKAKISFLYIYSFIAYVCDRSIRNSLFVLQEGLSLNLSQICLSDLIIPHTCESQWQTWVLYPLFVILAIKDLAYSEKNILEGKRNCYSLAPLQNLTCQRQGESKQSLMSTTKIYFYTHLPWSPIASFTREDMQFKRSS